MRLAANMEGYVPLAPPPAMTAPKKKPKKVARVKEPIPFCIILPSNRAKEAWDLCTLLCILFATVEAPFSISFSAEVHIIWLYIDMIVDAAFIVDLVLTFFTAFDDPKRPGTWVTDRGQIALNYLRGWFWIDAPASVPFDLLPVTPEDAKGYGMLRFLRLLRLMRLLKLLRLGNQIRKIELEYNVNLTMLRVVTMLVLALFLAHFIACGWWFVASSLQDVEQSWAASYHGGIALDASVAQQYLYSLQFAIMVLTSLGYGDMPPTTDVERVYVLCALLTGLMFFSYAISSINALVAELNRDQAMRDGKFRDALDFMREHRFPHDLTLRVAKQVSYAVSHEDTIDEAELIDMLSTTMRLEVNQVLVRNVLSMVPAFASDNIHPDVQLELYHVCKRLRAAPGEAICNVGEPAGELFCIVDGQVLVVNASGQVVQLLEVGQSFGIEVFSGRSIVHTRLASSDGASLLRFPAAGLKEVLNTYGATLFNKLYNALARDYLEQLGCYILGVRNLLSDFASPQDRAALRLQAFVRELRMRKVIKEKGDLLNRFLEKQNSAPPEEQKSARTKEATTNEERKLKRKETHRRGSKFNFLRTSMGSAQEDYPSTASRSTAQQGHTGLLQDHADSAKQLAELQESVKRLLEGQEEIRALLPQKREENGNDASQGSGSPAVPKPTPAAPKPTPAAPKPAPAVPKPAPMAAPDAESQHEGSSDIALPRARRLPQPSQRPMDPLGPHPTQSGVSKGDRTHMSLSGRDPTQGVPTDRGTASGAGSAAPGRAAKDAQRRLARHNSGASSSPPRGVQTTRI